MHRHHRKNMTVRGTPACAVMSIRSSSAGDMKLSSSSAAFIIVVTKLTRARDGRRANENATVTIYAPWHQASGETTADGSAEMLMGRLR